MTERDPYSPDIFQHIQKRGERIIAGHTATVKLVENISGDNPSKDFVGLPVYQFLKIAKYTEVSPRKLAISVPISQPDFISLARRFDEDFISSQAGELRGQEEEYEKIVGIVSKRIASSDLGVESSLGNLSEDIREGVLREMDEEIKRLKRMEDDRGVMVGIIARAIVRSDLDVEGSLGNLSGDVRGKVLEELEMYESGEREFTGIKTVEMFDSPKGM